MSENWKKYLFDIRFIIGFFFLIRLIGITNPPLEVSHNWRQCTTNMYARNFLEIDNNILYSRVDMAGELTGITAKEFPVFNYLIYLTAEVFGWQDWYGRLINLIVSSIGVWFFYLIICQITVTSKDNCYLNSRKNQEEVTAFYSTIILLCSIWFAFSRKIMPDTFSLSLGIIGLYFGLKYLGEKRSLKSLLLYFLFGTLAVLSKIPALFIFSVLVIPFFQKSTQNSKRISIALVSVILLGINLWWYFYWMPLVVETYGYVHYPMRSFMTGAKELFSNLDGVVFQFAVNGLKSIVAFALYVFGLIWIFWKREKLWIAMMLLLSGSFLVFMIQAGTTFYHHDYYMIPFAPVMALVAGYFLTKIPNPKIQILVLSIIFLEGVLNQQNDFWIPEKEKYKLELETLADQFSDRNDLVIFNENSGNPQQLYFAHRKGWMLNNGQFQEPILLDVLKNKGAKFIFINKSYWEGELNLAAEKIFENEHYFVFKFPIK